MFQRLFELSGLLGINRRKPWELLNHGMDEQYDRGFAICFDEQGDYDGIRTINSNQGVNNRGVTYLPGPSSNSPPLIPCTRLSQKMETKIKYLFQCTAEVGQTEDLPESWREWLARINWQDKELQKNIVVDLADQASAAGVGEKIDSTQIKRSGYCFPARYIKDCILPLYEEEAARSLMVKKALQVWQKHGTRQGSCSICGQEKDVFGNFSELKCYILDKPGLITGGFKNDQAKKNFPVCRECAFALSFAINYSRRNLIARMAGQDYIILPYCSADPQIREFIKEELEVRPDRFTISSSCDPLVNFDDELLEFMQEENLKEQLAFALIFFKKKNKEWKILAEVQQVLPGRMRRVRQAKHRAQDDDLLIQSGKQGKGTIISGNTFFYFSGSEGLKGSNRTLLQWLAAVYGEDGRIERRVLLQHIVKKLLAVARREPQKTTNFAGQAWGLYLFCSYLQLFDQGANHMTSIFSDSIFGQYMAKHPGFFSKKEMTIAFLTGCYVSKVCAAQYKRGMKKIPFAKKYQGRLLSRKHLRRLLREGHDKLSQYESLGYVIKNGLELDLAQAWVECGEQWNINDEEVTFAFTLGASLAWKISTDHDEDDKKNEGGE
ncbi:MAG: TM1802 family CRISPR-associated protein [Thermodesulfobacteriota bacterium]|nr:TM1802 family CRISPR-associated protein [Thermodesulfobacteriota bacterium]